MSQTNQRFVHDLNRLITAKSVSTKSFKKNEYDPIPAQRGIGDLVNFPKESSGGIASPLKEVPNKRTFHPPQLLKSSDGLFVIEQQALKSAVFLDANGNEVVLEFENVEEN